MKKVLIVALTVLGILALAAPALAAPGAYTTNGLANGGGIY